MHEYRGIAVGVAIIIVALTVALAGLAVVFGWTAFGIYALVKLIGSGSDEANEVGLIVGMVLLVTALVTLIAGAIKLVGKAMEPAKRRDEGFEAPGF